MKSAVFATGFEPTFERSRVTGWLSWDKAQDEWMRLDDRRRAGELPHVKFLEVRSSDDPKYNGLPYRPWDALPESERPQWVKLSRTDREHLLDIGRKAGDLQSAHDEMFDELMNDPEWSHLPAVTISDYTWAAARFCFPQEAKYL